MIQTIQDVNDCVPLYLPHSLYLKPLAKFNISVALPATITGKTISNFDVMEKMRQMILPDKFSVLKVSKSTVGFIRFEGELEDRGKLKAVLARLDGRPLKLAGFDESVKVRASEAKDDFPTRHDWDSFFRDARNMDEMKAGERPDTIHFSNLPIKWFCPRHAENEDNVKPSESIFKRIFEKFGEVRAVDIPICDPYRSQMKAHMSGMKKFSFDQEMYFEGYVQFNEYVGFVKTMDEFRGMKLVRKEGDRNLAVTITVDFDQTKHLSDASVKKRQIVRDRLIAAEREKEELEKKRIAEEEARKELERKKEEEKRQAEIEQQLLREQRRKEKHLQKLRQKESDEISLKIRLEEKKLLEAQRKLESIRLLDALFERMKMKQSLEKGKQRSSLLSSDGEDNVSISSASGRQKKANKLKQAQEKELEKMRLRLKQAKDGSVLKQVLSTGTGLKVDRSRSPSINTISSDDSILSDTPRKAKKKRKSQTSSIRKSGSSAEDSSAEESTAEQGTAAAGDKKREVREEMANQQLPAAAPYAGPQHIAYDRPVSYAPMHPAYSAAAAGMYAGMDWTSGMSYPYTYDPYYAQYYSSLAYRGAFRTATRGPRYPRGAVSSGSGGGGVTRGRGSYRGSRGGYDGYRGGRGMDDYDGYDRSRSASYSRSRSRSRSRHRRRSSRSRSRSRSRHRRSRSRSSRSRSRSRSRSHRRSRSRRSRSRSSSRSRSKSGHRSRSHSRSRSSRSHSHRRSKRRSRSGGSGGEDRSKKPAVQMSKPVSKNLVSTIRGATRSRSHSRSRSRSHSRSRSNYKHRSSRRHRTPQRSRRSGSRADDDLQRAAKVDRKQVDPPEPKKEPAAPPVGPIGPRSPPEPPMEPSLPPEQNGDGDRNASIVDEEEPPVVSESFKKHRIILRTDQMMRSTKEIEEEVRERLIRQQKEREEQQQKQQKEQQQQQQQQQQHQKQKRLEREKAYARRRRNRKADEDEEDDDEDSEEEEDDDEEEEEQEERSNRDRGRRIDSRRNPYINRPPSPPPLPGNGQKPKDDAPRKMETLRSQIVKDVNRRVKERSPLLPLAEDRRSRMKRSPEQQQQQQPRTRNESANGAAKRPPRTPPSSSSSSSSTEEDSEESSGSSASSNHDDGRRRVSRSRAPRARHTIERSKRAPRVEEPLMTPRDRKRSTNMAEEHTKSDKRARVMVKGDRERARSREQVPPPAPPHHHPTRAGGDVDRRRASPGRRLRHQRSGSREDHRKSSHSRPSFANEASGDESFSRRRVAVRHGGDRSYRRS
ncbi:A-kinase anchor protein 17A-like [Anopheles darlingi]|uniref:A-kinase anchor protein 17A-like n=1 Tax=Anopheles darlingi TaxID=43151 RepID=UPI0020FFF7CD|nr:A-kinase anchor protein 17A-like [Anopheles darlingi]